MHKAKTQVRADRENQTKGKGGWENFEVCLARWLEWKCDNQRRREINQVTWCQVGQALLVMRPLWVPHYGDTHDLQYIHKAPNMNSPICPLGITVRGWIPLGITVRGRDVGWAIHIRPMGMGFRVLMGVHDFFLIQ